MQAQQQSVISTQSPIDMQHSQMNNNHHVSDEEAYGESNGYPTLSNLFAVANQQNNNNNIIEGTITITIIHSRPLNTLNEPKSNLLTNILNWKIIMINNNNVFLF